MVDVKVIIFVSVFFYLMPDCLGDVNQNILGCLLHAVETHLYQGKSLVVSSSISEEDQQTTDFTDLLGSQNETSSSSLLIWELMLNRLFLTQQRLIQVFYNSRNTKVTESSEHKHDGYLVISGKRKKADIIDDVDQQMNALKNDKCWNPRAKIILLVQEPKNKTLQEELTEAIFSKLWKFKIINILAMTYEYTLKDVFTMNMYTWFPYHPPGRCGNIHEPILLDTCIVEDGEPKFLNNTELFPNKLNKNLHGCKLKVSTFELGPVSLKIKYHEDGSHEFQEGIEVELLRALAKSMNMTVFYMPRPDESLWGVLMSNGTWTGFTGEVIRGYSDVAAANLWYKCHIAHDVECLTSHTLDPVKWWIPCAQPYPRWTSITRVFKASLWLGFLAAYILFSLFMHLVIVLHTKISPQESGNTGYKGVVKVLLNFWAVILEESASNNPPHVISIRSVFFTWVLYCWAVNTVYQTYLVTFLVDPGLQHQITTEQELLNSKTVRHGFDADIAPVMSGLQDYTHAFICKTFLECRMRLVTTNRFAFAFGVVPTEYIIAAKYMDGNGNPLICHFDAVIANQVTSMAVRKGYPLYDFLNKAIRHILEAGLVDKWFKDVKYNATLISSRDFNLPVGEYVKLSLEHLQSAFYFLFLGFSFCLAAFIGEIICYRKQKSQFKENSKTPKISNNE